MLKPCPECELQISDKAMCCPHCGYPVKTCEKTVKTRKTNKHRRLPNGFGQISEIKNSNLRNPFRAMVTTGKNEYGKPICKLLKPKAYFPTYNDAYAALLEYNKNPYEIDSSINVEELYEKWSDSFYQSGISDSAVRTLKAAWTYCEPLYKMKVNELKTRRIKECIENAKKTLRGNVVLASANTKIMMKSIFCRLLDYAVEYEITDKNCARSLKLPRNISKELQENQKHHISFTDEEMILLWKNIDVVPYVDMLIVQCYSGWRPQELCGISIKNINIENQFIIGGSKTEAGKNRVVPIHSRIKDIIERKYDNAVKTGNSYLFNYNDTNEPMTYRRYSAAFHKIVNTLNLNPQHRPHDGRVQFVTLAKKYNLDEYAIKYIVGHAISDITEKIYTHREIEWLKDEIEKIK